MFVLRPYQDKAVIGIRAKMRAGHRRVNYVLATGGGKTAIFSYVVRSVESRRRRALILVHRKRLMRQAVASMRECGITPGIIAANTKHIATEAIVVASVQTLVNRLDLYRGSFDLVVLDECHHAVASQWSQVLEAFGDAYHLGVTATPERVDGSGLGDHYDTMIVGPSPKWLIAEGYLSDFIAYVSPSGPPDLSGVRTAGGDYAVGALAEAMSKRELVGDCLDHYRRRANGMPALGFAVSVDHAQMLAAVFRKGGYRSEAVWGDLAEDECERRLNGLRDGTLDVVWSCDLISEGVDIPGVACVIGMRPTQSLSLHLQQYGRGIRPFYASGFDLSTREGRLAAQAAGPKPKAIFLDHAGNCHIHGLPDMDREWSLYSGKRTKGKRAQALRTCPKCFALAEAHKTVCESCGRAFPIQARRPARRSEGELVEADRSAEAQAKAKHTVAELKEAKEKAGCKTLADFQALAKRLGYKPGWAWGQYQFALKKGQAGAAKPVDRKALDRELEARLASVRS